MSLRWLALAATLGAGACASALHQPPPVEAIGPSATATPARGDVDRLLAVAETALARRPDAAQVELARELFLAAARGDDARVEGLLGAMRATAWLVEHDADAERRAMLAGEGVELGQWCGRRAPSSVECDYRLALALGQQARERPSTAHDGLERMVALLEHAAAAAPDLDGAGPDRVLALVRLRAPGWPAGPGDPEAGLERARRAVELAPDEPANQLALGEALGANGQPEAARTAFQQALSLAGLRVAAGDPDAAGWRLEAEAALERRR